MKKVLYTIFALISIFAVSSCATTGNAGSSENVGMIENATPENSVIVYGFSSEPDIKIYYVDEKNNWETVISTGNRCFSLPPAHKGGKIVAKGSSWVKRSSSTASYGNQLVTTNYSTYYEIDSDEWNVNVPTDKPLYFMGYHSIQVKDIASWESLKAIASTPGNLVIGMPKTQAEYDKFIGKFELKSLNQLLKKYKGTAWESVINERIAELKK